MLWEEPKGPDFVLEITSRSTRTRDQGPKRGTYAFLGVREYFQYDPTHDYLVPALQGARLVAGSYQALLPTTLPDGTLMLHSEVLELEVRLEEGALRFYDPATGQRLLSHAEIEQARRAASRPPAAEQARREAEERAGREEAARQAAEARIAELEARLREQGNT